MNSKSILIAKIDDSYKWGNMDKANNVLEGMLESLKSKGYGVEHIQSKDEPTEIITEIDKLGCSIQEKIKKSTFFTLFRTASKLVDL